MKKILTTRNIMIVVAIAVAYYIYTDYQKKKKEEAEKKAVKQNIASNLSTAITGRELIEMSGTVASKTKVPYAVA